MIDFTFLPIDATDLNSKITFEFAGVQYKIRLRENKLFGFFSIDVFTFDDIFIYSSNLIYGANAINSRFPDLPFNILPLDITELTGNLLAEKSITAENLGDTVRLYTSLILS